MPIERTLAIVVGDGGAPPVATRTRCSYRTEPASGWLTRPLSTTGAAQKWETLCSAMVRSTSPGSTLARHTCRPPTAVTAQAKHQPLQWNIGKVQRYTESLVSPKLIAVPSELRYAPRCVYTTPLGRPDVPLV